MPGSTIGDLRQHFYNVQTSTRIKNDLNTLVQEMTTGEKSDLTAHLGPGQSILSSIDRQLDLLEQFSTTNLETAQMLSTMQIALGKAETQRASVSDLLLKIDAASSSSQKASASREAEHAFRATIAAFNTRLGDRALFGGNDVSTPPLADAEVMLNDIRTHVSGLSDPVDVGAAIDSWFDDAGSGFETLGSLSQATGSLSRPTEDDLSLSVDVSADDQAVRDLLKAYAKAAFTTDASVSLDPDGSSALLREAGVDLLTASAGLTDLQARLGYAEGKIAEVSARISAQEASFSIARNDLVSADPYETAAKLEAVQAQLETHYIVTARLSRLSLTEFLR